MSVPGASPALGDDPTVPRLVQVIIEPDGATMSCFYCQRAAPIVAVEVDGQILRFQDAHFGCDPIVAGWTIPVAGTVPRQTGRDVT